MKGFKPTGFGPTAGFTFPTKMGFTGSTGRTTAVAPYVRRKAFAEGGFVRQDTPRMKEETIGDQGSALVRRKKPYAQWQADVGATSSLLPGFKKGGATRKRKMRKADGGAVMSAGPLSTLNKMRKKPPRQPVATTMKEKFAADGGRVDNDKPTYMGAVKDRIKEMLGMAAESNTGMAKRAADKISGREKQIDDIVDSAQTGKKASNYARGGKMKRMGYASGGAVSRGEAKKIAERTVGEHVRYPAPKGHRGLGQMMGKRT